MGSPGSLSVALATYNGGRFLAAQLASIAAQDRRPDEIVVGDDQSTDDTQAIVERFAASHDIPVSWQRNATRLGTSGNFESIIRRCRGDIVVFCDQDDLWMPDRLSLTAAAFAADPASGYVFSDGLLIDDQDRVIPGTVHSGGPIPLDERRRFQQGDQLYGLLRHNLVLGATMSVRRTAVERILPFEPDWVHDYYIAFALSALGHGTLLDEALIKYRRHAGQQIGVAGGNLKAVLALARRQDAAHCRKEARKYQRMRERLLAAGLDPARPVIGALAAKARFCEQRAQMRERPARAPGLLWRAWRQGDYRHYALGWRQALLDVVGGVYMIGRSNDPG
jgi:glycosyltransferase involved in cell wall biosynthesis